MLVDGEDVGLEQIRRGLAWHFKRYAHEQSAADRAENAREEDEARAAHRGLWRDRAPVPPWEGGKGASIRAEPSTIRRKRQR